MTADLLTQMARWQGALRGVQRWRRGFVALGGAATVLVVLRVVALAPGVRLAAVWWWGAVVLAAALAAVLWRGLRAPAPGLPVAALWVEEQLAAARASAPDFTLTTAVELLAAGHPLPPALGAAAASVVAAPTAQHVLGPALARTRRRAWLGPALYLAAGLTLLLVPVGRPRGAVPVPGGRGDRSVLNETGATVEPLGAWTVQVTPPAYTGLPATTYGDVSTVPAVSGSVVTLAGTGGVPVAVVETAGMDARPVRVRGEATGWLVRVPATAGAQAVRVARGGRARLFVIEGRADSVPQVALEAPARDSVFREPRGVLPLAATAHDDIGLGRAHFELVITSGEGERFTVRTVLRGVRTYAGRAGTTTASLRDELDLAALQLQAGDVVHLRAVARDAHPAADREFGSSETRAFRIARPTEYDSVAVEPAPPPEVDTSLLSQRMLLLLTEKLDKGQRRMARPDVLRESLKLARDQARLRLTVGDVVFQRLSGESSAEHAHYAGDGHDHAVDQQGGKLVLNAAAAGGTLDEGNDSPVVAINQPLLEAYNAMWDAGRALEQGDPHGAIPAMKRALEAIERSRAASRLYLRGRPPQVIVDIAKVRLTGRDTGQVTNRRRRDALPSPAAARDLRLVRAAGLVASDAGAARDTVALLRVESLADAPAFASALGAVLAVFDRGGDVTKAFVQARRVLGTVARVRATVWSRGVAP